MAPGPVYFYSDESGAHSRGRYLIVAGVALDANHHASREMLRTAEVRSKKDVLDWHSTTRREVRREYLKLALSESDLLHGRVFYRVFQNVDSTWNCTVVALAEALRFFAAGRQAVVIHQGFTVATRDKLKEDLEIAHPGLGRDVLEVRKAKTSEPLVRLADSVAGLVAIARFADVNKAGYFDSVFPPWLVDLETKAPLFGEGGASLGSEPGPPVLSGFRLRNHNPRLFDHKNKVKSAIFGAREAGGNSQQQTT